MIKHPIPWQEGGGWRSDSPLKVIYTKSFCVTDNKILDVKKNRGVTECVDG